MYFQHLQAIVLNDLKNTSQLVSKILVNKEIFKKLVKSDFISSIDNDTLISFMYRINDSICSFAVKQNSVYFEEKSFSKMARTVLIKCSFGTIIEIKKVMKENGFYKSYDSNVYFYDLDYRERDYDKEEILDKLFSDEFGVSCAIANKMRKNFSFYAKRLSFLSSEAKMRNRDNKLSNIDFLNFRSPWLVSLLCDFIEDEYNLEKESVIKKVFNRGSDDDHLSNMTGITKIIEWLQNNIGRDSEFVISNNIFQNLVPVMIGEDAGGFDTKGIIVEKMGEDYFLYQVHFTTDKISFVKSLITLEQAQGLFLVNPLNENVKGLKEFFGITRGR